MIKCVAELEFRLQPTWRLQLRLQRPEHDGTAGEGAHEIGFSAGTCKSQVLV